MESGAGAVDNVDSSVVRGGFAVGGLAAACLEENVGVFISVYVTGMKPFGAAEIVNDVIREM